MEMKMVDCIIIGCRHNTVEFINTMLKNNISVDAVVTINESVSKKVDVSGFVNIAKYIPSNIPIYKVKSYSMSAKEDYSLLSEIRYRVGICIGWQRLIPEWFLNQAEVGIFGMHASRFYLPGGRGRSPINWSIIEGAREIHATVFRYAIEADAGDILDICDIDITQFDTIRSVQQKCRIAFNRIIEKHYPNLLSNKLPNQEFLQDKSSWYEKRTPQSGHINWHNKVKDIYDFIRAQTKPYPGAFAVLNNIEYRIWLGYPFGNKIKYNNIKPGTILEVFFDGKLLVQCEDNPIYITEHELYNINIGDILL
jgi:methionyl-tRNA formyltransferase